MSFRAWLLLKIIPFLSAQYRTAEKLAPGIEKDRKRGAALPSARARKRFSFSEADWAGTRVLRLAAQPKTSVPITFFYLHGGAYTFQIQAGQWSLVTGLLERLGGDVVAPLYPLAPEHDWREGQAAVRRAYLRVVKEHGADNVVVIGDSAGGGLALALVQTLRDMGEAQPAAVVMFSPWLDLSVTGEDQPAIQRHDPALAIEFLRAAGKLWARDIPANDPRVSPLFGNQAGLPPTMVFTGTNDILDSDAHRLAACNPDVRVQRYQGMFHVWAAAPLPEGKRALDDAAAFVRESVEAKYVSRTVIHHG